MKRLISILQALIQAAGLAVTIVELTAEGTGEKGKAKEDKAVAQMRELFPPEMLPEAFRDSYDIIARMVIRAIVAFFNATGFFEKSGAPPS